MSMSLPRGISSSELLAGTATPAQATARVREYRYWLCALVDAWYELDGPILEDCGVYRACGLALGRHDSGITPGSVAPRQGSPEYRYKGTPITLPAARGQGRESPANQPGQVSRVLVNRDNACGRGNASQSRGRDNAS
jgi:hypothetical protein